MNRKHDAEREARADERVGDERNGRKESVPPAAPQPATLAPHSAGPATGSVAPTLSGSGESSSPSVGSSVAEPTESAIIFGFESASDFEDSRLYELLSGCRAAALRARITWRAMNEDRRVEVDEWWRMLTDEDWESLGEIPDDDYESFAEYQARIAATEARTLGGERENECDDTRETKDSVVVEAASNAVPSTLSVPRSSPK